MNRNLYRIIFNARRGLRMAVSEAARSCGRTCKGEARAALGALILLASAPLALAQIVADPNAPATQKPTVLNAANGVPLVNIQAPSAAGVSRNTYKQFDVQPNGAILNNSRNNVQTTIGGWVQGNPWLAAGSARVILNEVNSSNPSLLKGWVEVAGQRAEVIIANPAGIQVGGAGFLNASRVTLTTGTPVMNGGNLESYRVQGGAVTVSGAGLDLRDADYASVLARAVQVNAGIWAKNLKVVAGANTIDAASESVTAPAAPSGAAPSYMLDVAQLGGMYAGHIYLVGTEAGVGVNTQGTIQANAGQLVLLANGQLTNTGVLQAAGAVRVEAAGAVSNSGTIHAQADAAVRSGTSLQSSGVMASGGNLSVLASGSVAVQGQALAAGQVQVEGSNLDLRSATVAAQTVRLAAQAGGIDAGASELSAVRLDANTPQALRTDGAKLLAEQLSLTAASLSNVGGQIVHTGATDLSVQLTGNLDNTTGRIVSRGSNVTLSAASLNNNQGRIEHAGNGTLSVTTAGTALNTAGTIATNGSLAIDAQQLDNAAGRLEAAGQATVATQGLVNTNGVLASGQDLTLQVQGGTLANQGGAIQAGGHLAIISSGLVNNSGGTLSADGDLSLRDAQAAAGTNTLTKTLHVSNTAGTIAAAQATQIDSRSISADGTVSGGAGVHMKVLGDYSHASGNTLQSGADLHVEASGTLTNNSTLRAAGDLTVAGQNVINAAGASLVGADVLVDAGNTVSNQGTVIASRNLKVQAGQKVVNSGAGQLLAADAAGTLSVLAPVIENRDDTTATDTAPRTLILGLGKVVLAGAETAPGTYSRASSILNRSAQIESGGDMMLAANQITNARRQLAAGTTFAWSKPAESGSTVWTEANPNVPGGRYVEPPHGGSMNSDYLYTAYTTEFERNAVTAISPQARIIAGGNLAVNANLLKNHFSRVAAAGSISLGGATLDQNSWQGAQQLVERQTSSGTYEYRTYKGFRWNIAWGPSTTDVAVAGYDSSFTAGAAITGNGASIINGSTPPAGTVAFPQTNPNLVAAGQVSASGVLASIELPTGAGLFRANPDPAARYLIETNPAFADYRTWVSSDWMLGELGIDPAGIQKRLGDGFYEQRLVREQVLALTGKTRLGQHADDDAQYLSLLQAGVALARQHNLRPGVALTPQQVASLTTDVVVLETRTVAGQQVLVPVVYLAHARAGDLLPSGALVAAQDIELFDQKTLANRGTLKAARKLVVDGQDIDSRGGNLQADEMQLKAQGNVDLTGGQLKAGALQLEAGGDLLLASETRQSSYALQGAVQGSATETLLDRIAGIDVAGNATINTGGNLTQKGARLAVGGQLSANIGGNWVLDTVETGESKSATRTSRVQGSAQSSLVQQNVSTVQADSAQIQVGGNIQARGAQIQVTNDAAIRAQGDMRFEAATDRQAVDSTAQSSRRGRSHSDSLHTSTEQLKTAQIQVGGNLTLQAGRDMELKATNAQAAGAVNLQAGGNLSITSQDEEAQALRSHSAAKKGVLANKTSHELQAESQTIAIGSRISGNSVRLEANRDIEVKASSVDAQQGLAVQAGGDVRITAALESVETTSERSSTRSPNGLGKVLGITQAPLSMDVAGFFLKKRSSSETGADTQASARGSTLTGQTVDVRSGRDTGVQGSTVIADDKLSITAGRHVTIESAQNTQDTTSEFSSKKSGQIGKGIAFAVGSVKQERDTQGQSVTQTASTIASLGGDIELKAGEQYRQVASDVTAVQGDVSITAKKVAIEAGQEMHSNAEQNKFSKKALGVTVDVPLINAVKTIRDMAKASDDTGNSRVQALAAATAALKANEAIDSARALSQGNFAGVKVTLSLSNSKSSSQSNQNASTAVQSNVQGHDVTIAATGAGNQSNIEVTGSNIAASRNASLQAEGDVKLQAAQNTYEQHSTNKSSGASIGIGFAAGGSQNGFTLEVAANKARGNADGTDVTWTETQVKAGSTARIESGNDTTLKGAVVQANQVQANVGGNLNVESLQDTSTYDAKQSSAGVSVSICVPPFCYGTSTVGGNLAKAKAEGDFASVKEQSGIKAGDGGFQAVVTGTTDLKGAVIASSDTAAQDGKNVLVTGTLTHSDIQNRDHYEAESFSIAGSVGFKAGDQSATNLKPKQKAAADAEPTNSYAPGFGSAGGNQSSVTRSGVSPGAVVIADEARQEANTGNTAAQAVASLNRDVSSTRDTSGSLVKNWDGSKLILDVQAQATITAAFQSAAAKAIGDYAAAQLEDAEKLRVRAASEQSEQSRASLQEEAQRLEDQWGDRGSLRLLAHTVVGGLTGGSSGAAGAAAGTLTAPLVSERLAAAGVKGPLASTLTALASTLAGAAAGGSIGAVTASNEVVNNFLSHQENQLRKAAIVQCDQGDAQACAQRDRLNALDKMRDDALRAACRADGGSVSCNQWIEYAKAVEAGYRRTPDSAALRDELRFGIYSDAAERQQVQRLINSTPHAQPLDPQQRAVLGSLVSIALDLTPVVGDVKGLAEAETPFDYTLALIGTLGPVGDAAKVLIKEAKVLAEAGETAKAAEKLADAQKEVHAVAGAKGSWTAQLNGKLDPSTVYKLDNGHAYATDAAGRVKSVDGELSLTKMDRNGHQQCAVGKCGEAGDEGGHLIAAALGGAGDRINIVPQSRLLNRQDWRSMEREFQSALKEGKSVTIKIEVGYPAGTGVRPDSFRVTASIDGKRVERLFEQ